MPSPASFNGVGGGRSCPPSVPDSAWGRGGRGVGGLAWWIGNGRGPPGARFVALLLVAAATSFLAGEGGSSGGVGFAAPSRRLVPLAALAFVSFATEGAIGGWSGTYRALGGVGGLRRCRLCGLLAIDDHRQGRRRRNCRRCGTSVTVDRAPHRRDRARGRRRFAWARRRRRSLRLVRAGIANVVPVLFSVAGRAGSSAAAGIASTATSGYAGLSSGPLVIGAVASACDLRSAIVMLAAVAFIAAAFASSRAGGLRGR